MLSTANAVANIHSTPETAEVEESGPVIALPPASALVSPPPKEQPVRRLPRILQAASDAAAAILPTLVVLGLLLAVWQFACVAPGSPLPSPSRIWT